jgi:hypothetical protein
MGWSSVVKATHAEEQGLILLSAGCCNTAPARWRATGALTRSFLIAPSPLWYRLRFRTRACSQAAEWEGAGGDP